eukprot:1444196-Pleurochrysis_carterae.AAC.2
MSGDGMASSNGLPFMKRRCRQRGCRQIRQRIRGDAMICDAAGHTLVQAAASGTQRKCRPTEEKQRARKKRARASRRRPSAAAGKMPLGRSACPTCAQRPSVTSKCTISRQIASSAIRAMRRPQTLSGTVAHGRTPSPIVARWSHARRETARMQQPHALSSVATARIAD